VVYVPGGFLSDEVINHLNQLKNLELSQRTPLRVLHRRSNSTRIRHVHSINAVRINSTFLELKLETSAGTYVKEFVHGDFGRTSPSMRTLIADAWLKITGASPAAPIRADIIQLDVEGLRDETPYLTHLEKREMRAAERAQR
jgi:tRNA pseudouridine synthase 10